MGIINEFYLKRVIGFMIAGSVPLLTYMLLLNSGNIAIFAGLASILVCVFIGLTISKNVFTDMVEGKGILTLDLTSKGVARFFLVKLKGKQVKGKLDGIDIRGFFNRKMLTLIKAPEKVSGEVTEEGNLTITIPEEKAKEARFVQGDYGMFFYNSILDEFITKEMLFEKEEHVFTDHTILETKKAFLLAEQHLQPFTRMFMEQFNPKKFDFFKSPIAIFLIVIIFLIAAAVAFPMIQNLWVGISGSANAILPSVQTAVTPSGVAPIQTG